MDQPYEIIESLNVRGIKIPEKRNALFNWLKKRKSLFILLVDTHCNHPSLRGKWRDEWSKDESDSLWSLGTNRQKGVAILVNPRLKREGISYSNELIDSNGRYIKIIVNIDGTLYRLVCIYAPPNDKARARVKFFIDLNNNILNDEFDCETIMGGDYNCTLNADMDRFNCVCKNNDLGQIDLFRLIHTHELEDIYRRRFPYTREYTWYGQGKSSRIDYWLTSKSLNSQIQEVSNCHAPRTDHRMITLKLRTNDVKRGKGIWKLNTSILFDHEYKQKVKDFWNSWRNKKQRYPNIGMWWDVGKIGIKELSLQYSTVKSIEQKAELEDVEIEINHLRNTSPHSERLKELNLKYDAIVTKRAEGDKIRSKIRWWEEGEKSTKYFHNLEKSRAKQKAWDKILDKDGKIQYGTSNIIDRQVEFYKGLFTSEFKDDNHNEKLFFLESIDRKLSEISKNSLDSDIQMTEIVSALKKMPNGKSPGSDGLPAEFYKIFWGDLGHDYFEVVSSGLEDGELSYTQYLAVISLLYKKGPREDIRNWRPISLLNIDYKIISKVLAERLKLVLHEIIHPDQRGCVPGRFIGENIRHIDDILFEIENGHKDPIILMLDQEKAFDRVEWNWLFSTLEKFNFGDRFISWLKILYKNSKSCILTNGVQSEYFNITRGIRQGDALSALLFIIQFEPLAQKLRTTNSIDGVSIPLRNMHNSHIVVKGAQYVDDSNTFLKNKTFVANFLEIMGKYENASGSKMNSDKTLGLSLDRRIEKKIHDINITLKAEKVLGIDLGGRREKTESDFWDKLVEKLGAKLKIWNARTLSLEGKVYVIKSVGIAQLMYAMEMKCISDSHKKKINDILWHFLWYGKNPKFNKAICKLPRDKGGLGLIDIDTLVKVKRINWVIRVLKDKNEQNWSKMVENYLRCLDNISGVQLFALKVTDSTDLLKEVKIPQFYKECLQHFQELCRVSQSRPENDIIWCNSKFVFVRKTLQSVHWARSGIIKVSDLYNENVLSEEYFREILNLDNRPTHRANFIFDFMKVKAVFPHHRPLLDEDNDQEIEDEKEHLLGTFFDVPDMGLKQLKDLTSKDIYRILISQNEPYIKSKDYWKYEMFPGIDLDWNVWFQVNFNNKILPKQCKDFNIKLFHGWLSTETRLRRMKYSDGLCKCCQREEENLEHLLIKCHYRSKIWKLLQCALKRSFGNIVRVTRTEIIAGLFKNHESNQTQIINMCISVTRFHIWKTRNSIKKDDEVITFKNCAMFLKYKILDHANILLKSTMTSEGIKALLPKLIDDITDIFSVSNM